MISVTVGAREECASHGVHGQQMGTCASTGNGGGRALGWKPSKFMALPSLRKEISHERESLLQPSVMDSSWRGHISDRGTSLASVACRLSGIHSSSWV
jgi:hypothetical protein